MVPVSWESAFTRMSPSPRRLRAAYNDWLIDHWLSDDPRFLGSILVSQMDPEAAASEIRRLAEHPQMVQISMTSASRLPLGDRFHCPIYDAAQECGLPVAIHPGCEGTGVSSGFSNGFPSSYLEWHTNLSQNFMAQLISFVCRGALTQFPDMKLILVEGGFGWLPHLMWRLDKNWKGLRSTVPWLKNLPSELIKENVRLTTQPFEEPQDNSHLHQVLEMIDASNTLLFSSDYPHWDNDAPTRILTKLPGAIRENVAWKNAATLYQLPPFS